MKLTEGTLSHVAAHPHTGLLGILIKHREQLEPGNRITGNAAVQLVALSRSIIEALGGKQVDGRWEVEIGGDTQDLKALADLVGNLHHFCSKLDESQGNLEDKFDDKVLTLQRALETADSRIAKLEHMLAEANAAPIHTATATIDIRDTPAIVELRTRIDNLEQSAAAPTPRKRSTAKAEEKPTEPQGE